MLIEASTIINMPIGAADSERKVGTVNRIIMDPDDGKVIGFLISVGNIFKTEKSISSQDVLDIDKNGLVINTEENILETSEIIRISKIVNDKITIFNQNAYTESKKNIGKVYDFIIDSENYIVTKYYIKNILDEKILPADKVTKIDRTGVYFSNDVIERTPIIETEGAAA